MIRLRTPLNKDAVWHQSRYVIYNDSFRVVEGCNSPGRAGQIVKMFNEHNKTNGHNRRYYKTLQSKVQYYE